MNDLIKIEQTRINGAEVNSVNSRHIYEYLEIDTAYTTWFNRAVDKYGFEENMDFIPILKESNGGRPEKEIALPNKNVASKIHRTITKILSLDFNAPNML